MAEIASAYVTLIPSARGFGRQVEGQVGGEVERSGKSLGGKLMGGLKVAGLAAAAGVGGVLAASLTKGWGRLTSIENAEAKLKGLGNSSKSVAKIMDNALASVKGTAFGMDEAATTAASVVAAGIKPGKQLETVLKTVADTATIAGTSMGDMGTIFGSVAARGKLQGDDLMQLQSRGVPVLAMLAKHYGVSAQEASKMVSKGKVDFKNFAAAMKENLGGAALKSGETTQGAFKNMGAALSRFGAGLLKGVFPLAKKVFGGLTAFIDDAAKAVQPFVEQFSTRLGGVFTSIGGTVKSSLPSIKAFVSRLLSLGKVLVGDVVTAVKDLAATFGPMLKEFGSKALAAAPGIFSKVGDALRTVGTVLTTVTGFMRAHATTVQAVAVAVAAGVLAWKAWTTAISVWQAVTKIAAGVQAAFNAVMAANPVMLVVIAIAALAAGLVYAYKHSETFRNVVNGVFNAVKGVVSAVVGWFTKTVPAAFGSVVSWVKAHWPLILGILTGPVGLAVGLIVKNWDRIKAGASKMKDAVVDKFKAVVDWIKSIPGKITGALGNLGDLLLNAGKEIIGGLLRGITEKFEDVKSFVGGIGSWIGDHKGPLSYDRKLLVPAGKAIIGGLDKGLQSEMGSLERTLGMVTDTIRVAPLPAVSRPSGVASGAGMPSQLVIVDADGQLMGTLMVAADQRIAANDRAQSRAIRSGAGRRF